MKKTIHHIFWFWFPPLLFMFSIALMSSIPNPKMGGNTPDYILHSLAYFLLTLLIIRLLLTLDPQILYKTINVLKLVRKNSSRGFNFWQVASLSGVFISVLFGILNEFHQYFIPGRYCSLQDVLANFFGALMAYGIAMSDRWVITRIPSWNSWIDKLGWLKIISYAGHLPQKET